MIKIGLLNIQNVDNYGANLIAYSMEQELKQIGLSDIEITTLNFCPDIHISSMQATSIINAYRQFGIIGSVKSIKRSANRSRRYFLRQVRSTILFKTAKKIIRRGKLSNAVFDDDSDKKKRQERFDTFHKEYLNLTEKFTSANMDLQKYDIIIVGSDVVWKPARLLAKEENKVYFLLNTDRCKKIAYAASIGINDDNVLGRLKKRYAEAIDRFDYISVRERSAKRYIQSLLPHRDVMNCIDPVFLRSPEEYLKLITDLNLEKKDYIYVYLMGNNQKAYQYASKLATEKHLSIIYYTNFACPNLFGESSITDGPCEFLHRIYYAKYIVTDTFHGTAFSLIFRKKFITFTRGNMSIRLVDFLTGIGLKDRLVESVEDMALIDNPIDYDAISDKIEDWASLSRLWLQSAVRASAESLNI